MANPIPVLIFFYHFLHLILLVTDNMSTVYYALSQLNLATLSIWQLWIWKVRMILILLKKKAEVKTILWMIIFRQPVNHCLAPILHKVLDIFLIRKGVGRTLCFNFAGLLWSVWMSKDCGLWRMIFCWIFDSILNFIQKVVQRIFIFYLPCIYVAKNCGRCCEL